MMIPHLSTAAIGAPITRLGVSFFPIYLPANDLPDITTGPSSELDVRELEDAAVGSLLAVNPTDTPVLIVEGEHFLGGKQNRAVNISVLVPPRNRAPDPRVVPGRGEVGPRPVVRARRHARLAARPQTESGGRRLLHGEAPVPTRRSGRCLERGQRGTAIPPDALRHGGSRRQRQTGLSSRHEARRCCPRACGAWSASSAVRDRRLPWPLGDGCRTLRRPKSTGGTLGSPHSIAPAGAPHQIRTPVGRPGVVGSPALRRHGIAGGPGRRTRNRASGPRREEDRPSLEVRRNARPRQLLDAERQENLRQDRETSFP